MTEQIYQRCMHTHLRHSHLHIVRQEAELRSDGIASWEQVVEQILRWNIADATFQILSAVIAYVADTSSSVPIWLCAGVLPNLAS